MHTRSQWSHAHESVLSLQVATVKAGGGQSANQPISVELLSCAVGSKFGGET
jgi:hypothetical protein